jgi:hypothetical protein
MLSDAAFPGEGGASYQLYGVALRSDFPFRNRLVPFRGPPDVTFTCRVEPLEDVPAEVLWPPGAAGDVVLYRCDGAFVIRFTDISTFALRDDSIEARLARREDDYLVEIQLLGMVLALWLEQRGVPALHAAAVAVGDRAAAFLGSRGSGKTSMAAAFLREGADLLTEDLLAIQPLAGRVLGHPGYPQMRMWPDQARHFIGDVDQLPTVHPAFAKVRVPLSRLTLGSLSMQPRPLRAVYVLDRQDRSVASVSITPVSQGDAVMELIRSSFVPELLHATGQDARRLPVLARTAVTVPVFRLRYPHGLEHLSETCRVVTHHLRGLGS